VERVARSLFSDGVLISGSRDEARQDTRTLLESQPDIISTLVRKGTTARNIRCVAA
jgi:hypothetical protein